MNKYSFLTVATLFSLLVMCSCTKTDDQDLPAIDSSCGELVQESADLFDSGPNDEFSFVDATIKGNCLNLTIQYGGGCDEIELKLFDAESVAYSNPPQRAIRLSLKDEDHCEALITKEISFDLSPLKLVDHNELILNLSGWDGSLTYQY